MEVERVGGFVGDARFNQLPPDLIDDRLGLLHDLTREISRHGLEVYISKAALVLDQVTDTFYLKDGEGKKVVDPEILEALERGLLAVLQVGEGSG